jgi:peroxiredoxin
MKWRGISADTAEQPAKAGLLRDRLLEIKSGVAQYVRPENQAINDRVIAELRDRSFENGILAVGSTAPEFALPDQRGALVSLRELLVKGKLIVNFYRGRWCPFCMTSLEAWRDALRQATSAGASIVAISPQLIRHSAFTADQHKLTFPVLSDEGNHVAGQFRVRYDVPEYQRQLFRSVFINLENLNGMKSDDWSLPMPATYVIGQDGRVEFAFASADYTRRAEPAEVIARL